MIPRRPYLIVGPAGTGKSTLALQFLCEGVRRGERTLFVTLEEPPNELRVNHRGLGAEFDRVDVFDAIPDVMRYERVPFKDISAVRQAMPFGRVPLVIRRTPELTGVEVTITALEQMLRSEVTRRGYTRVVIDSLTALQYFCMKGFNEVAGAQTFLRFLSDLHVTTFLTVESPLEDVDTTERMLARGEIRLFRWEDDNATVYAVGVEKFRGGAHDVRLHPYRIGPGGLDIVLDRTISRDTRKIVEPEPIVTLAAPPPPRSPIEPLIDEVQDLIAVGAEVGPIRTEIEAALAAAILSDRHAATGHVVTASAMSLSLAADLRASTSLRSPSESPAATAALRRIVERSEAARTGIPPTDLPPSPDLEAQLGRVLALIPPPAAPAIPAPVPPPPAAVPAPVPAMLAPEEPVPVALAPAPLTPAPPVPSGPVPVPAAPVPTGSAPVEAPTPAPPPASVLPSVPIEAPIPVPEPPPVAPAEPLRASPEPIVPSAEPLTEGPAPRPIPAPAAPVVEPVALEGPSEPPPPFPKATPKKVAPPSAAPPVPSSAPAPPPPPAARRWAPREPPPAPSRIAAPTPARKASSGPPGPAPAGGAVRTGAPASRAAPPPLPSASTHALSATTASAPLGRPTGPIASVVPTTASASRLPPPAASPASAPVAPSAPPGPAATAPPPAVSAPPSTPVGPSVAGLPPAPGLPPSRSEPTAPVAPDAAAPVVLRPEAGTPAAAPPKRRRKAPPKSAKKSAASAATRAATSVDVVPATGATVTVAPASLESLSAVGAETAPPAPPRRRATRKRKAPPVISATAGTTPPAESVAAGGHDETLAPPLPADPAPSPPEDE